jgi:hypothetical protein
MLRISKPFGLLDYLLLYTLAYYELNIGWPLFHVNVDVDDKFRTHTQKTVQLFNYFTLLLL